MQVVEDEHDGLARGERLEQRADRAVRAVALVLQAGGDAADGGHDRGELGQLVADEPLQPVDAEECGVLGQRVLPDAERQLALEFGRAAVEDQRSGPVGAGRQLVEQPRLADPALAAERDHGALAVFEPVQRGVDGREFRAPSEQRSVTEATRNLTGAAHPYSRLVRITPRHLLSPPRKRGTRCI